MQVCGLTSNSNCEPKQTPPNSCGTGALACAKQVHELLSEAKENGTGRSACPTRFCSVPTEYFVPSSLRFEGQNVTSIPFGQVRSHAEHGCRGPGSPTSFLARLRAGRRQVLLLGAGGARSSRDRRRQSGGAACVRRRDRFPCQSKLSLPARSCRNHCC